MVCCACIEHRRLQATICESKECLKVKQNMYSKARHKAKKGDPTYETKRAALAKTPRAKYNQHRNTAKERGIVFSLTSREWWNLWESHWEERGKSTCMCRTGDTGAYEIGNVRIDTYSNNKLESINLTKSEKIQ